MKLSTELQERGFIYQFSSDSLEDILDGKKRTVYLGIDPTADSIHVGTLVPYMLLTHLMMAGHKVVILIGGGTALIGDPGGKTKERPFVDISVIEEQSKKMEECIRQFVAKEVVFVNNYNWLSKISMIEYLRDIGKHFTVNSMIKKDIVSNRLTDENPISYTEFSYSLLQSYDYYHLHKEMGCDLQIGGSDQWSNIISGVDYVRRVSGDKVYALTLPIINDKSTGKKFGKSEGNAIWLDAKKTSPYVFYQFWLNTSDDTVIDYLKIFTLIPLDEIAEIEKVFLKNTTERHAQKRLAYEVTSFVHTQKVADTLVKISTVLFGDISIDKLSTQEVVILKENVPIISVNDNMSIIDMLTMSDLATSKREARTFIQSNAVHINNQKITYVDCVVNKETYGDLFLLKRGKKKIILVEIK